MPLPTPPPLARSLLLLLLSLLSVATLNTHERVLARLAARGDERVKRQLPTEINIQNGTRRAELGAVPAVTAELVEVAGVEATIYRKRRQTIQELSFVRARGRFEREIVEIVSLPPVTAPLFSSRLFDYGTEEGDEQVPGGAVDVGKRLELTYPLTFFNRQHRTVYILSNGGIGFDPSSRSYTPGWGGGADLKTELFPGGPEMIAPFWNRNNMRKGGKVYYRELKEGARVLERGQSEIRYQYDKNVKARSGLLVTWVGMQPLGPEALPEDNTNTFQALILQTDNGTYANFIYKNIGWTQGARAGFNKGAEEEFYELPTSGTGNIMYLEEYGNTGIPGEWIFEIDMPKIVRCKSGTKGDTCDQTCAASEWGYDCAGCCHCAAGGKCDVSNGQCQGGGGQCAECWTGFPLCQERQSSCRVQSQTCAHNAISFTDYDRCGEPLVRCQCLAGYTGDGHSDCQVLDLSGDREDGGEDDVDECAGETSPCHRNAICVNTPGRYYCECRPGFTGDGINDCSEAFLYPFLDHQSLPRRRDSKVVWDLQYEFFIFGRPRGQLIISDQGLIAVSDLPRELRDPLADGVIGFAPFFAPVDLSLGGNVFVDEASDAVQPEVVQRATNVVREMYGETAFVAKTVFIVTFHNVTNQGGRALNTYQMNLIGGILPGGRQATYVEYLYKDLEWSSGAEAAIIPEDGANAIVLPGSKTQGIVQLAQLSNLAKPGQWMWRVDGGLVEQCPRRDLQPPYCDQTIQAPPPRPQPPRQPFLPQPQQPQPPPITRPAAGEEIPIEFQPRTIQPTLDESDDARRVTVTFPPFITVIPQLFTPPQSVVAIRARPDNTPPSRNGLILPPQVTQPERPRTNGPQTSRTRVTPPPGLSRAGTPDFGEDTETDPPFRYTDPPRFQPTQPPFQHPETDQPPGFPPPLRETLRPLYPPTPQPQPEQPSRPDGRVPVGPPPQPSIIFGGQEFEPRAPQTPSPPSPSSPQSFFTPRTQQPPSIQFTRINPQQLPDDSLQHITPGPEYEREDENEGGFPPIQVFTTPRRRIPVPTRPPPVIISGPRTTTRSPFQTRPDDNALDTNNLGRRKDPEQDLNSPSKLAIIIPTAIVGVWLLLLLVIGLVVCCRRRKSRKRLRSKYDPSYHFRQSAVGAYPGGREPSAAAAALPQGRKHKDRHAGYPHASYEDHLEKAARLSEMSQYSSQQNGVGGRLYGSYWNVAGEGGGGGGRNRNQSTNYSYYNQGYYDSCPEFQQRYAYAGRY